MGHDHHGPNTIANKFHKYHNCPTTIKIWLVGSSAQLGWPGWASLYPSVCIWLFGLIIFLLLSFELFRGLPWSIFIVFFFFQFFWFEKFGRFEVLPLLKLILCLNKIVQQEVKRWVSLLVVERGFINVGSLIVASEPSLDTYIPFEFIVWRGRVRTAFFWLWFNCFKSRCSFRPLLK